MSVTYTYDFVDFTSLDPSVPYPNATTMPQEIIDAGLTGLLSVDVLTGDDIVEIVFSAAVTVATLDAVVAAHTGLDPLGQGPGETSERFRSVATVEDAKALDQHVEGDVLFVHELNAFFAYTALSSDTNDDVRVLKPDNITTTGRWLRFQSKLGETWSLLYGTSDPNGTVTAEQGRNFYHSANGVFYTQIASPEGNTWAQTGLQPSQYTEEKFTPTLGQVTFLLANAPADDVTVDFLVNGNDYNQGVDFSVSGQTVTWLNVKFSMEADDEVLIRYIRTP